MSTSPVRSDSHATRPLTRTVLARWVGGPVVGLLLLLAGGCGAGEPGGRVTLSLPLGLAGTGDLADVKGFVILAVQRSDAQCDGNDLTRLVDGRPVVWKVVPFSQGQSPAVVAMDVSTLTTPIVVLVGGFAVLNPGELESDLKKGTELDATVKTHLLVAGCTEVAAVAASTSVKVKVSRYEVK